MLFLCKKRESDTYLAIESPLSAALVMRQLGIRHDVQLGAREVPPVHRHHYCDFLLLLPRALKLRVQVRYDGACKRGLARAWDPAEADQETGVGGEAGEEGVCELRPPSSELS